MIPRLEDMTVGQRFLLLIVVVLVILFALAAFGYFGGRWDQAEGQAITEGFVVPARFHDDVLALDRQALDAAYEEQLRHLFRNWITDRLHDPSGIDRGAIKARQGYVIARERIEKRESK